MSKFFLKKSYINLDMTVEDYFDNISNEIKIQKKVQFTPNATIIKRSVKQIRSTVEEITDKEYNEKIKKSNIKKNKSISTSEVEKED
jgi:glycosylphosphatidylinositol transamidase (GPIT) subunit GPI8|tara:strand:- start:6690 stop:6950 length:261 start_codon:yes stop_codon:yes gene_type:complete